MPPLLPQLSPWLQETTLYLRGGLGLGKGICLPEPTSLLPGPSEKNGLVAGLRVTQEGHMRAVLYSGPGVQGPFLPELPGCLGQVKTRCLCVCLSTRALCQRCSP